MTITARDAQELRSKWAKAHADARVPVPHGHMELRVGVTGPFQVIWRDVVTTAYLDGRAVPDPRTIRS